MKSLTVVILIACFLLISALPVQAASEGDFSTQRPLLEDCLRNEESFGFELKDYPIEHQTQALLNIAVKFRFIPEVKDDTSLYPDVVLIVEDIREFLIDYPNETDYWEIVNKNLVNFLMDQYTSIASLCIKLEINPTIRENYERHSVVTVTRRDQCPLISQ